MNTVGDMLRIAPEFYNSVRAFVTGPEFPWYSLDCTTSYEIPMFTHMVVHRDTSEVISTEYNVVVSLLDAFCAGMGLKRGKILRAAFNSSLGTYDGKATHPHVDYPTPHRVFLFYFTEDGGDTIVFNEQYDSKKQLSEEPILTEKIRQPPIVGKVLTFKGSHYHMNEFPEKTNGRRIVLVVCTEEQE